MKDKEAYKIIREEILEAVKEEESIKPFNLFGRGHEFRVTLDRRLAAILRELNIPCVIISGYGANYYYPERVFKTAQNRLNQKIKESRFQLEFGVNDHSVYLSDEEKKNAFREKS